MVNNCYAVTQPSVVFEFLRPKNSVSIFDLKVVKTETGIDMGIKFTKSWKEEVTGDGINTFIDESSAF